MPVTGNKNINPLNTFSIKSFSKYFFFLLFSLTTKNSFCQDNSTLLKEAANLEKQFKEPEALEVYKKLAATDTSNISYQIKCTELSCSIGARQKDDKIKIQYYKEAKIFAQKAYSINSNDARSNYAMALVAGKMTEVEDENKKVVEYVKQTKVYGDNAVALNPNNAKANYIVGKWHYEMINLNWAKKIAVKALYGGLSKGNIDSAFFYMEQCCKLDIYFTPSYLDLAKAYMYDHQPGKAIEVLNKLVKLPNRVYDDAAIKAEGKKLLESLQ